MEYPLNLPQMHNKTCWLTGATVFSSGVLKSLQKTGTGAFEQPDLKFVLLCSECIMYPCYVLFCLVHPFCFTESWVKMSGSNATVLVLFWVSPVLECLGTLLSFILGKEMLYPWLMDRVKRVSESEYQSLKITQQSWIQQSWFGF